MLLSFEKTEIDYANFQKDSLQNARGGRTVGGGERSGARKMLFPRWLSHRSSKKELHTLTVPPHLTSKLVQAVEAYTYDRKLENLISSKKISCLACY